MNAMMTLVLLAGRWVASDTPYKHSRIRSALGVCWAFTLSGLMHELILWSVTVARAERTGLAITANTDLLH